MPVFQQPDYVENFVQSIFDSLEGFEGKTLVIGGDGRYYNREVIQIVIEDGRRQRLRPGAGRPGRAALDAGRLARDPQHARPSAASSSRPATIPAARDGDFGIKYNVGNGGPAPEKITDAIFARTRTIAEYKILDAPRPRPRPDRHPTARAT